MKNFLIMLLFTLSSFAIGSDVPSTPPDLCYSGCTEAQQNVMKDFQNKGVLPEQAPAVYSGVCNHLGMYSPNVDHHAVVLLDQHQGKWKFGGFFSFFYQENKYRTWDLAKARAEISPNWKDHSVLSVEDDTARVVIRRLDGTPAYIYWLRQDPITKDLLYLTYSDVMVSFCRLEKH